MSSRAHLDNTASNSTNAQAPALLSGRRHPACCCCWRSGVDYGSRHSCCCQQWTISCCPHQEGHGDVQKGQGISFLSASKLLSARVCAFCRASWQSLFSSLTQPLLQTLTSALTCGKGRDVVQWLCGLLHPHLTSCPGCQRRGLTLYYMEQFEAAAQQFRADVAVGVPGQIRLMSTAGVIPHPAHLQTTDTGTVVTLPLPSAAVLAAVTQENFLAIR